MEKRNFLARRYESLLGELPLSFQKVLLDAKSSYHLFVVQLESSLDRKYVFDMLRKQQIGVNVHYIPIYKQPYYRKFNFDEQNFKGCENYYKSCISLPLYPELSENDQDYICESLAKATKCLM